MLTRWTRTGLACVLMAMAATAALGAKEEKGRAGRAGAADKTDAPQKSAADLPANIKALVAKQLPNGTIESFDEQTDETRHLFFVDVDDAGKKKTLLCSGQAQYLGILDPADNPDDDDDNTYLQFDTAPPAVKTGLTKIAGDAKIDALSFEVDREKFFFVGEFDSADGKTHFATVNASGQLTEEETDLDLKDLPKPVKDAITAAHPKAKLDSASTIVANKVTTYAVDFVEAGKNFEAVVTPEGTISSTDPLDDDTTKPAK